MYGEQRRLAHRHLCGCNGCAEIAGSDNVREMVVATRFG